MSSSYGPEASYAAGGTYASMTAPAGGQFSGANAQLAAAQSAGDCTGACGGMESACCEAEGALQNTNWQFVGDGRGSYSSVPQYGYVGEGRGSFEREVVTTYYGWKIRKCCIGLLVIAMIPLVLYLMVVMSNPALVYANYPWINNWKAAGKTSTSTPVPTVSEPYDCFAGGSWTKAHQDWCCRAHSKGCTTQPPTTKVLTTHRPPPKLPVVRVPVPVPLPAPLTPATSLPFDCNAGYANWQAGWSLAKKAWCCQHAQRGCPVISATTSPHFDCNAGFARWKEGWSVQKKVWCCQHQSKGCPESSAGALGSCTVWGDPHILTFDGMRSDYYGSGEYWIVKTADIHIQARYLPTKATNGLAVTKILAIGGPFLEGHKLLISPTWTTWDGRQILQGFPDHFEEPKHVQMTYNAQGELLQKGRQGKAMKVVHALIADGTEGNLQIQVNRWTEASEGDYINAKITMRSRPGQDGHCGNFNGKAADDDRLQVRARLGKTGVPPGELLFKTKTPVAPVGRPDINNCPAKKLEAAKADCRAKEGKGKFVIPSMSCLIDYCFGGKEMAMAA